MIDRFDGEHAFLSNFWPWDSKLKRYIAETLSIPMYGELYPTLEHAFQAAKTLPGEHATRKLIRSAASPGWAKRLGQRVRLRPDWDTFRLVAMEELLRRKFADPALRALLEMTKPHKLVEGNNWDDAFWGMVHDGDNHWHGENHLGRLLMKIRDEGHS